MSNALVIYDQFDKLQQAAIALQESGYFSDVKSKAQAIVKVMAGAELGLPPFASMAGIHIIQGKPTLGSNVMATLVKNDPRYDYRIKQADNNACILTWYEGGQIVGESSFTMQEAKAGNVDKSWDKTENKWKDKATWKAFPSDMLFARAISRGARRFAPGIFGGSPVYTPDEMGADVDEEGNVVSVIATELPPVERETESAHEPASNGKKATGGKSWGAEFVKALIDNDIADNPSNAVKILNRLQPLDVGSAVEMGKAYRAFRDQGKETDEAFDLVLSGERPQ